LADPSGQIDTRGVTLADLKAGVKLLAGHQVVLVVGDLAGSKRDDGRALKQPAGAFGRLRIIDDVAHTQETRRGMAKLCCREYRLHSKPSTRRPFSRRTARLMRRAKSKL